MQLRLSLPSFFALLTFGVFTGPVVVAMAAYGQLPLPHGYTATSMVSGPAVYLAILIFAMYVVAILAAKPLTVWRPTIMFSGVLRQLFIWFYLMVSVASVAVVMVQLDFVSRLVADPFLAVLSFGVLIAEEKLLGYFFLGMACFAAYGVVGRSDNWTVRAIVAGWCTLVCVFYLLVGRREIALMLILMLVLRPKSDISVISPKVLGALFTVMIALLSYTSLRSTDEDSGIAVNSVIEELSPVPLSAYVIDRGGINDGAAFLAGTTPLRTIGNMSKSISEGFFIRESNSSGVVPVLGIAGSAYEFGFVVPLLLLLAVAILAKTSWLYYLNGHGDHWRVYSIYLSFKVFNVLRNGEFALVVMDVIMFSIMVFPLLVSTRKPVDRTPYGKLL
jgi:hypothetical protein